MIRPGLRELIGRPSRRRHRLFVAHGREGSSRFCEYYDILDLPIPLSFARFPGASRKGETGRIEGRMVKLDEIDVETREQGQVGED